jgi:mRNA interferase RelE/StbE
LKTVFKKRFLKELARLPQKTRILIEEYVFEKVPKLKTIEESKKVEKMKGYSPFYKIRFGDYRVGIKYIDKMLIFERVLHRKDIYKYFP